MDKSSAVSVDLHTDDANKGGKHTLWGLAERAVLGAVGRLCIQGTRSRSQWFSKHELTAGPH